MTTKPKKSGPPRSVWVQFTPSGIPTRPTSAREAKGAEVVTRGKKHGPLLIWCMSKLADIPRTGRELADMLRCENTDHDAVPPKLRAALTAFRHLHSNERSAVATAFLRDVDDARSRS